MEHVLNLEQLWDSEVELALPDHWVTLNLDDLVNKWGFASDRWQYGISPTLCDISSAFIAHTPRVTLVSKTALARWLERAGLQWVTIQQDDLNNDGTDDWLALLE